MGDRGEVLVTWPGFELDGTAAKRLRAAGLRLRLEPKTGRRTSADVERLTRGAVAATISTDPFDRSVLAAADQLRVIARVGVGTDTIDLAAATEEGIVVTITPGANQETTADHAIAIMLAALRRIVEHDASVRRGEWERGAGLTPWDVHGVVVGIVGYGAIGRAVARRLEGFGAELLICDPAVERIDGAHVVAPPELLERADIVSLARPADGWNTCVDRPRGAGSDTAPGPVGEHVAPLAVALRAAARETHVRVAAPHSDALAPALDADVVLPQASDPRTVEAFALRLRYPPEGRRGYGPRRAGRHRATGPAGVDGPDRVARHRRPRRHARGGHRGPRDDDG